MSGDLTVALAALGGVVLAGVVAHGAWQARKADPKKAAAAEPRPEPREPVMGSEDFADMLFKVPGVYCTVGHAGSIPPHNPGYVLDDGILPVGASLLARIVEKRLAA